MDEDRLIRWFCVCHGLHSLILRLCSQGGLLCLTFSRPSKPHNEDPVLTSWEVLGSPAHVAETVGYSGIPHSVVVPVYASTVRLRFRQPTVEDIFR